jgi:8-amino-7-oxononanoate synthase
MLVDKLSTVSLEFNDAHTQRLDHAFSTVGLTPGSPRMDGLSQASMIPSSLEKQLIAALKLREVRQIRRVLPPSADTALVDFSSNDYLSLSKSTELRNRFLEKLGSTERILGSGGSRLLINGSAHVDLEDRLQFFFSGIDAAQQRGQTPSPAPTLDALLFNSGFDANVGFFACVPQPGDFVVYDEYIHASVHDGMRMSRAKCVPFQHNSVEDLEKVLLGLKTERTEMFDGNGSVFIAVEGLYSMDGTIPPLEDIVQLAESAFPKGNAYVSVDEAHSTGIYGPNGRGLVNLLGLQDRVFARLHTFGKALAGTGGELLCSDPVESPLMYGIAVLLVPPIVKQYLINYARTLIYTTSLSYANIISANCSFDLLESGRADEVRSCF